MTRHSKLNVQPRICTAFVTHAQQQPPPSNVSCNADSVGYLVQHIQVVKRADVIKAKARVMQKRATATLKRALVVQKKAQVIQRKARAIQKKAFAIQKQAEFMQNETETMVNHLIVSKQENISRPHTDTGPIIIVILACLVAHTAIANRGCLDHASKAPPFPGRPAGRNAKDDVSAARNEVCKGTTIDSTLAIVSAFWSLFLVKLTYTSSPAAGARLGRYRIPHSYDP